MAISTTIDFASWLNGTNDSGLGYTEAFEELHANGCGIIKQHYDHKTDTVQTVCLPGSDLVDSMRRYEAQAAAFSGLSQDKLHNEYAMRYAEAQRQAKTSFVGGANMQQQCSQDTKPAGEEPSAKRKAVLLLLNEEV